MITLEQLRAEYKPQIMELAEKYGMSNIRVFGSVARGDADEDSDIDLLYTPIPPNGLWEACGMHYYLEDLLKDKVKKVDFVCDKTLRPHFVQSILSEAVPL